MREAVHVEGIESISLADLEAADELGYRVKLLGVAQRTEVGIEQRVHPTMVRQGTVIAEVDGVTNAVAIDADTMELTLMGPGAGGAATASAVVADLMDLARGRRVPAFGRPAAALTKPQRAPMQRHEGGYYIRLAVVDRPGTAADHRAAHGGREDFARNRSCSAAATAGRMAARTRRGPTSPRRWCSSPMRPPRTRCAGRWRRSSRTASCPRSRR